MLCGNCGTENEEMAPICVNCGASLQQEQAAPAAVKKSSKKRLGWLALAISLVAILAVLALIFVIKTPRSTVNKFFNGFIQGDAARVVKLLPKDVQNSLLGQDGAYAKFEEKLNQSLNKLAETGLSYSFKATHVDELKEEDYAALEKHYADTYGRIISDAKNVEVRITAIGGEEDVYSTATLRVVRIGVRWYLDIVSVMSFFG